MPGVRKQRPGYYVKTIEPEKDAFTPQKGVRHGPWTKWGLRKAIRQLWALGYSCEYSSTLGYEDPSVLIYRVDGEKGLFD